LFDFKQKIDPAYQSAAPNDTKCYLISGNRFVVFNEAENELAITDAKSNRIKAMRIRAGYHYSQLFKVGQHVLINLGSHDRQRSIIYICDYDLNPMRSRCFDKDFLYLRISQDMIYLWDFDLKKFLLYNLRLELVGQFERNTKIHGFLDYILYNDNRLVFNCFHYGGIKIVRKDDEELIKTIRTHGYSTVELFVDMASNIFVIVGDGDLFHLDCYDVDANLLFRQSRIFDGFFNFVVNGEDFYLFDNNFSLRSIF
jgi:hypothetical protein